MIEPPKLTPYNLEFVEYKIVKLGDNLPFHSSSMFEYLIGSNGIFVRAVRLGLEVIIPVEIFTASIRGLELIEPLVRLTPGRIPQQILIQMWKESCIAALAEPPLEITFHLHQVQGQWRLVIPEQTQSSAKCRAIEYGLDSSYINATVEVHSHNRMAAFFSGADDADEGGFRIFVVLGRVTESSAEIICRVGVYRQFWHVPADWIFELPSFIVDVTVGGEKDDLIDKFYSSSVAPSLLDGPIAL
jgi:PRTRC genetic system protein A